MTEDKETLESEFALCPLVGPYIIFIIIYIKNNKYDIEICSIWVIGWESSYIMFKSNTFFISPYPKGIS